MVYFLNKVEKVEITSLGSLFIFYCKKIQHNRSFVILIALKQFSYIFVYSLFKINNES